MSGGPPHHPHNRQNPATNSAWNHLQVPNFFPRQPLHAHMSTDPAALLHQVQQPTWHVPTTEPLMKVPMQAAATHHPPLHHHHHLFSLEQMVAERQHFPRDLSSPRNGSGAPLQQQQQQNGDLPLTPPISLSVRDTNKINSLPASALDISLKSTSPGLKSLSPGLSLSPAALAHDRQQLQGSPKTGAKVVLPAIAAQRSGLKRGVDSILERLNPPSQALPLDQVAGPTFERPVATTIGIFPSISTNPAPVTVPVAAPAPAPAPAPTPAIIDTLQASINAVATGAGLTGAGAGSGAGAPHDDNSNSSSALLTVPTPSTVREEDVVSPYSNDDNSRDSSKSRRKRKPSKTVRVSKEAAGVVAVAAPVTNSSPVQADLLFKQASEIAAALVEQQSTDIPPSTASATVPPSTPVPPPPLPADNNTPHAEIPHENKIPDRRKSVTPPLRNASKSSRRKVSSESESIANIAAMVQEMKPVQTPTKVPGELPEQSKTVEPQDDSIKSNAVPKEKPSTPFAEVENKLEEMFAGLEDGSLSIPPSENLEAIANYSKMGFDNTKDLLKLENNDTCTNTPVDDTSNKRTTRSSGEIPVEIDDSSSMGLVNRRRRKTTKKSPKRLAVANSNTSTPCAKATNRNSVGKLATSVGASANVSAITAQKLSSDIKDIVANSYDSGSNASSSKSRGPFIQIKGPRDSPHSVCIVNSSTSNADCDEHHAAALAATKIAAKAKFHDDSEYRQRVRVRGLHCSTLSTKYDAQTRDTTWICAFCKRGPHAAAVTMAEMERYPPPGDLFGPYVITTACAEYQRRLDDPYDKQFKSKKVCRSLDAIASTSKATTIGRGGRGFKRKLSESQVNSNVNAVTPTTSVGTPTEDSSPTSEQSVMLGITIMDETDSAPTTIRNHLARTPTTSLTTSCYEVWAHEDCIVWSAGVHLAGGGARIIGLEAAVWASSGVTCVSCSQRGANVCCMRRGCARALHYGCARVAGWTLREEDYAAFCPEHAGLTPRGTPAVGAPVAILQNGEAVGPRTGLRR